MGKVRKKKKRRKKRYLLKFTILVALFVGAYFFFTSELFDIQKIQVEQNSYYTAQQVISIAGAETGVSLFKVRTSKMKDRLLKNPYIQSAKVSRHFPNRLIITVKERKEFAAVAMENVDLSKALAPDQEPKKPASGGGTGSPSPAALKTTDGAAGAAGQAAGTTGQAAGTTGQAAGSADPAAATGSAAGVPAPASGLTAPAGGAQAPESGVIAPSGGAQAPASGVTAPTDSAGQDKGAAQNTGEPAQAQGAAPPAPSAGQPDGSAPAPAPPQPPRMGTLYVIIDQDGLVLRKTDKAPAIPVIYGLTVKDAEPGKPLKAEENLMFSDTLAMVKSMNKNDLFFKKIQVSPVVVKAYIYDNLVCEGPPDAIEKSMKSLKDTLYVLYQQGIQRGVIHASGDDHMPFTFSPEIEQ